MAFVCSSSKLSSTILILLWVGLIGKSHAHIVDWSQFDYRQNQGSTYKFGYEIEDSKTDNVQFRNEERHRNGTVTGSYGHLNPDGNIHIVHYVADKEGYRAKVENSNDVVGHGYSPEMIAALQSRKVYKKHTIFEQRLRPYDQRKQKH